MCQIIVSHLLKNTISHASGNDKQLWLSRLCSQLEYANLDKTDGLIKYIGPNAECTDVDSRQDLEYIFLQENGNESLIEDPFDVAYRMGCSWANGSVGST